MKDPTRTVTVHVGFHNAMYYSAEDAAEKGHLTTLDVTARYCDMGARLTEVSRVRDCVNAVSYTDRVFMVYRTKGEWSPWKRWEGQPEVIKLRGFA